MKKTLIAFSVVVMLSISIFLVVGICGCEWFDTSVLNKPKKAEIEAIKQKEKAEAEEQRRLEESEARLALEQAEKEESERRTMQELNKPYHVVLGCFEVKENSENLTLLLKNKGYQPYVFKLGGFTCVSAKSYNTLREAENALEDFLEKDYCPEDAWVYKLHP